MIQSQRWLHSDNRFMTESGVSFQLRYVAAVPVVVSIKSVDLDLRTSIAHAAIHQACFDIGLGNSRPRRLNKIICSYLGPDTQRDWALSKVRLTVTSKSLTVDSLESDQPQLLFRHDLSMVSFASGGDAEKMDFVCYVAKSSLDERFCYVFDCSESVAQDVIMTLGQAFQLGFQAFKQRRSSSWNRTNGSLTSRSTPPRSKSARNGDASFHSDSLNQRSRPRHSSSSSDDDVNEFPNENCTQNEDIDEEDATWLMDVPLLPPTPKPPSECTRFAHEPRRNYVNIPSSKLHDTPTSQISLIRGDHQGPLKDRFHELEPVGEPWYVGQMSRAEAERLLRYEGDFLVRASPHQPGQFVLSGLQDTKCRHLLLADPNGQVRTKEHVFDSIQHLIDYHVQNGVPIRSADSEIRLIFPVSANTFCEM